MMNDMEIAKTILEQLGGRRFVMMTGAKQMTAIPSGLSFRLPMKTKDGGNIWKITLMPSDTYKIETISVRGTSVKPKTTKEDIYCDMLQDIFEDITGQYVRL